LETCFGLSGKVLETLLDLATKVPELFSNLLEAVPDSASQVAFLGAIVVVACAFDGSSGGTSVSTKSTSVV